MFRLRHFSDLPSNSSGVGYDREKRNHHQILGRKFYKMSRMFDPYKQKIKLVVNNENDEIAILAYFAAYPRISTRRVTL